MQTLVLGSLSSDAGLCPTPINAEPESIGAGSEPRPAAIGSGTTGSEARSAEPDATGSTKSETRPEEPRSTHSEEPGTTKSEVRPAAIGSGTTDPEEPGAGSEERPSGLLQERHRTKTRVYTYTEPVDSEQYAVLAEHSEVDGETALYFIRMKHNEKVLATLTQDLGSFESSIETDLSIFVLDLAATVSSRTAREMILVNTNRSLHSRKFDGLCRPIEFALQAKDSNVRCMKRVHRTLGRGALYRYIDHEDLTGCREDHSSDSETEGARTAPRT
jgi:hypothetical protein